MATQRAPCQVHNNDLIVSLRHDVGEGDGTKLGKVFLRTRAPRIFVCVPCDHGKASTGGDQGGRHRQDEARRQDRAHLVRAPGFHTHVNQPHGQAPRGTCGHGLGKAGRRFRLAKAHDGAASVLSNALSKKAEPCGEVLLQLQVNGPGWVRWVGRGW